MNNILQLGQEINLLVYGKKEKIINLKNILLKKQKSLLLLLNSLIKYMEIKTTKFIFLLLDLKVGKSIFKNSKLKIIKLKPYLKYQNFWKILPLLKK